MNHGHIIPIPRYYNNTRRFCGIQRLKHIESLMSETYVGNRYNDIYGYTEL